VYWLRQPPYLRWIAAGLVLCCGIYLDTRPAPSVAYPFSADAVAVGDRIEAAVEWRDVPAGILPEWSQAVTGAALTAIPAGTPVLPNLVAEVVPPTGWWAVSLPLPHRVSPGTHVRVIAGESVVEGLVVGEMHDDGFELTASIAFASDDAQLVAATAANSALVVMVGSSDLIATSGG